MKKGRKRKKVSKKKKTSPINLSYFLIIIALTLFGLLMVFNASTVEGYQLFGNKFHFVRLQGIWALAGLVGLGVASIIPFTTYKKLSQPIFLIAILFLIGVLIPGLGVKTQGARRWIDLGFTRFQPSEFTKLAIIIYLSSWLSKHQRFAPFIFITSIVLGLIMLQPDLGTAIIVGSIAFILYFIAGGSYKNIAISASVAILAVLVLIFSSSYRLDRLKTFLDPTSDPLGTSYHIRQVLIALGSGGLTGQGIGKSRQKYQYLPEASTDSIFAIIAEETGFIGSILVIAALYFLINQGYKIASRAPDMFSRLISVGIISWIGIQTLINLAAMVALVPLTGVPLPLISYGGSSLVTILFALGIVINISKYQVDISKKVRLKRKK